MDEPLEIPVEDSQEPELHKKPLLAGLARSIFIDSIVEFLRGVVHFFYTHIKLLLDSFRFLWVPFYTGSKKEATELMNRSQAVVGFLLTVMGALNFLVKVNVIDEPDETLTNLYGNEQSGIMINVIFFVVLAISYFILQAILVLLGRLYRFIASPAPNTAANDMLFIHMGNQVFILGALGGLIMRLIHTSQTIDAENEYPSFLLAGFILFALLYLFIFCRLFWKRKDIAPGRKIGYITTAVLWHGLISAFIATMLVFFYVGV